MFDYPPNFFIGIDPSVRRTGISIIGPSTLYTQVIKPKVKGTNGRSLAFLRDTLTEIIRRYPPITGAAIEGPSYASFNRADDLGQVRGVYILTLHDAGIPVTVVPPTSLKLFTTGRGSATKEHMLAAARIVHPTVQYDDEADAWGLACMAWAIKTDLHIKKRYQLEAIRNILDPVKTRGDRFRGSKKTSV